MSEGVGEVDIGAPAAAEDDEEAYEVPGTGTGRVPGGEAVMCIALMPPIASATGEVGDEGMERFV